MQLVDATNKVQSNRKIIYLMASLFFLGTLGLCLGFLLSEDGQQLLLFGVAVISLLVVLFPVALNRNYFLFEPITFVILSVLFGLCLKTFYIILNYEESYVVADKLLLGLGVEALQYGSLVLLLGLVMFSFGYSCSLPRIKPIKYFREYKISYQRTVIFSFILIVISVVFFLLFFNSIGFTFGSIEDLSQKRFQDDGTTSASRLENISYYYYRLALVSKAPMYILFYLKIKYRLRWLSPISLLFFVTLMLNLAIPFFISNKAGVVLPIVDLIIIAYVVKSKIKIARTIVLISLVVAAIAIIDIFRGGDFTADYSFFDRVFGGRYFIGITKSAHIINAVPDYIDYFKGQTLIGWMNVFLPEQLKMESIVFTGLGFYVGDVVFDLASAGVPPGIVPELYMNFGLFGVILGMFIVGVVLSVAHKSLFKYLDSSAILIIYTLVVVRFPSFLFNNGVSVAILKLLADLIIVMIFLVLVKTRSRKGLM